MSKKAIFEAFKEFGRLALFAAVSAIITTALSYLTQFDSNEVWVIVLTLILRTADKYVHENPNTDKKGIAPF